MTHAIESPEPDSATVENFQINRIVWLLTAVAALVAAVVGLARPALYDPVVSQKIIPGVFTQDLVVALAAILMIVLVLGTGRKDYRRPIVIFGLLGFLFYAYGIYAIEQVYTFLYPLYLAIFALSFYGLVLGLASLPAGAWSAFAVPNWLRYSAAGYAIFVAVMFNFIWLSQLVPLLQGGERIEYTFSVFIIDLCFIMPAMAISGILALRGKPLGLVGLPALFIVGIGILSPLALAEVIKPVRYGMSRAPDQLWLYGILSFVFLLFTVVYIARSEITESRDAT